MTPRTPQCEVFWAFLLNSEHSGVPEDSKSPTLGMLGFTPTLCQSGVATFFVLQEKKKKRKAMCCYRRLFLPLVLLHCNATPQRRRWQLSLPSSSCCAAQLQCSSTKKATGAAVAFFLVLCNCSATPQIRRRQLSSPSSSCCAAITQLHKEGDGSYHRLFLPAVELRCSAAKEGDSVVELHCNVVKQAMTTTLPSPSSSSFEAALQRSFTKKATITTVTFFFFCFVFFFFLCSIAKKAATLY